MSRHQIILNVSGGIVQDVFASQADLEVLLVDWDAEGQVPGADEIVTVATTTGRPAAAIVVDLPVHPLTLLAGTDVGAAIEASEFAFQ